MFLREREEQGCKQTAMEGLGSDESAACAARAPLHMVDGRSKEKNGECV